MPASLGPILNHSSSVHLELHPECLLVKRKQDLLRTRSYVDDLKILCHAVEVLLQLFLAHVVLPFLTVFGEGLLKFVPAL